MRPNKDRGRSAQRRNAGNKMDGGVCEWPYHAPLATQALMAVRVLHVQNNDCATCPANVYTWLTARTSITDLKD